MSVRRQTYGYLPRHRVTAHGRGRAVLLKHTSGQTDSDTSQPWHRESQVYGKLRRLMSNSSETAYSNYKGDLAGRGACQLVPGEAI